MYIRKSKGPKTDPCGTPHVILEVLDSKPLIDANCLWFAKYDSNHLFAIHVFWNDIICSTECYDRRSEGQQKYHMQSYHHQELSLLPQSDLIEHMKLNNAAESQTEDPVISL